MDGILIRMANTCTQMHIHAIFSVQNRNYIIAGHWKDDLYKYITGIIQNQNNKLLAIIGMPDHIHLLFGIRPTQSLSDLMQYIKGHSSKWINKRKFVKGKFSWQEGYGAFSYCKSQLPQEIQYIGRQQEHHIKKTFIQEYINFWMLLRLNTMNVTYLNQ